MVFRHTGVHPDTVAITFSLPATVWADSVCVVGDFNRWVIGATPMALAEKDWQVSLELPTESRFEYRYVVNGSEWQNDWGADDSAPNPSGGRNSVIYT